MDHNPLESPLAPGTMGGRGQMGGHFILPRPSATLPILGT